MLISYKYEIICFCFCFLSHLQIPKSLSFKDCGPFQHWQWYGELKRWDLKDLLSSSVYQQKLVQQHPSWLKVQRSNWRCLGEQEWASQVSTHCGCKGCKVCVSLFLLPESGQANVWHPYSLFHEIFFSLSTTSLVHNQMHIYDSLALLMKCKAMDTTYILAFWGSILINFK